MAIDSALKRRSIGGIPFIPLGVNVTPNASKPIAWRVSVSWSYAGITPTPPAGGDLDNSLLLLGFGC